MRIAILNGNPDAGSPDFDNYLEKLSERLTASGYGVRILVLRDMHINFCRGCFDCWIKTPGLCTVQDDSHLVCEECINSGLVIFASPVIMGFTSALLKRANDKLIPLILYHSELVDNEYHHVARYEKYPFTGLLIGKGKDTDDEDVGIISEIYRRDAINFKTSLRFMKYIGDPMEEVLDEIGRI